MNHLWHPASPLHYRSTRGDQETDFASVIQQGLASDGGLFVPTTLPRLHEDFFDTGLPFTAADVLTQLIGLFSGGSLTPTQLRAEVQAVQQQLGPLSPPLQQVHDRLWLMELWHGPTAAFKDFALQWLPRLMRLTQPMAGHTHILTATSGDTGSAAIAGFAGQPGISLSVLYPHAGISEVQRQQMLSLQADNVQLIPIEGDFDACQSIVKTLFKHDSWQAALAKRAIRLSSANSINWGRILIQLGYHLTSYRAMLESGALEAGQTYRVVVPSGNFGNLLSAWYAKQAGLPIAQLVAATNRHDSLSRFLRTGSYDLRNTKLHPSLSPAMDIRVASNAERLVAELLRDPEQVNATQAALQGLGNYTLPEAAIQRLQQDFSACSVSDEQTQAAVHRAYQETQVVIDPHTAVGYHAWTQLPDDTPTLLAATAHWGKFPNTVGQALGIQLQSTSAEWQQAVTAHTGSSLPPSLQCLSLAKYFEPTPLAPEAKQVLGSIDTFLQR